MLSYTDLQKGTLFILDRTPHEGLEYNFLRMQQSKPVVQKKINEIKRQYALYGKKDVKVHLIGHSRGAMVASTFALNRPNIREKKVSVFCKCLWISYCYLCS